MKKSPLATPSAAKRSELYCPDEGDIVWVNLSPAMGHEQDGHRPALVLTPRAYNRVTRLCVVCAMTSQKKNYPFVVAVSETSAVLADQVRTISWVERRAQLKGRAAPAVVADVKAKLKALLSIP
jgi:mRNA interferase MazF